MTATIGIDTWKPAWYVDPDGPAGECMSQLARQLAGAGKLLPRPVDGHRVGWFPKEGMLYAEGHPGDDHELADPEQLRARLDRLEDALEAEGVPVPRHAPLWYAGDGVSRFADRYEGFAGVSRLDSTINVPMRSASEGIGLLAGAAALVRDMPRTQLEWRADGGGSQTVYVRGFRGKKVLGRLYDKGLESGVAPRGMLVRMEDQRRWGKQSRRDVAELSREYVRGKVHERFLPLWRATKGVKVAGPLVLAEKVQALIDEEELSPAQGERLVGQMVLEAVHVEGGRRLSKSARARWSTVRRELGLVVADGVLDEVEVDVHELLTEAMDTAAWGQG